MLDITTGHAGLDDLSMRFSSQVILECVKLRIKTNHHREEGRDATAGKGNLFYLYKADKLSLILGTHGEWRVFTP